MITNLDKTHYSLCYYIPEGYKKGDAFYNLIGSFKGNSSEYVDAWIKFAIFNLEKEFMHSIKIDYIISALAHNQLTFDSNKPISKLCKSISQTLGAIYLEIILSKNRITKSFSKERLLRHERVHELENVYELDKKNDLNFKNLLIVDDILTSGATLDTISNLIKKNYKDVGEIYYFTLAKTSREEEALKINKSIFEDFIPFEPPPLFVL